MAVGVEFHRDGLAALAAGGFEDGEVEVRAGGVTGIARGANPIAGLDDVADFDAGAPFLEVDVVAEGAVVVADQNIVGVPLEFFVGSAAIGVVFDTNDNTVAGRVNRSAFGHFEINRKFIAAGVAVFAVEALGNREGFTGRERERVDVRIVVLDGEISPSGEIGVGPVGFGFGIDTRNGENVRARPGWDGQRAGKRGGGLIVRELGFDSHCHVRGLEILDEERGARGGSLVCDGDQLFAGEGIPAEDGDDEENGRPEVRDPRACCLAGLFQKRHFKKG